jgi:hypothetical protein
MRKSLKAGAAAAILSLVAGHAMAAGPAACAQPKDMEALQAAAVQQRLMVAALSCNAVSLYNQFVLAYQKDLQASDKALQQFFRRLNSKSGSADYHAYKTRLANSSSITSIGDMAAYCTNAQATFDTALSAAKSTLAVFLNSQTLDLDANYSSCPDPVRMAAIATAPAIVPVPQPKPMAMASVVPPAVSGGAVLTPAAAQAVPVAPPSTAPVLAPSLPN